jgi:hypothetical protein
VRALRPVGLSPEWRAAVDGCHAQPSRACEGGALLRDLDCELTRRDEDERRRSRGRDVSPLDDRDGEGNRLAGPRRGLGEQIDAFERVGDDELLDGERRLDTARREGIRHGLAGAERAE